MHPSETACFDGLQTPLTSMRLSCRDVRCVEPCTFDHLLWSPFDARSLTGTVETETPNGQTIDGLSSSPIAIPTDSPPCERPFVECTSIELGIAR